MYLNVTWKETSNFVDQISCGGIFWPRINVKLKQQQLNQEEN